MTYPVDNRTFAESGNYSYHSLSDVCRLNDPKRLLQAISDRVAPDNQTLELVLKKTYEALQACGSYGPSEASDTVAQNFYDWERVVDRLLEQKVGISERALSYGPLIGRGMTEKLQNARNASCHIL